MYSFSVLLSCFIYKTLFLKNFIFSLDFPFKLFKFIYFYTHNMVLHIIIHNFYLLIIVKLKERAGIASMQGLNIYC